MWQSLEILNFFCVLTLKQIFSKTQPLFSFFKSKKVVKSTKTENTTFPNKTALSATNFKVNITKRGVLLVTILHFFRKFYFSLRTSYKELVWCTTNPNVHIHTFQKCQIFFWGCFFPVSILNLLNETTWDWCSLLRFLKWS